MNLSRALGPSVASVVTPVVIALLLIAVAMTGAPAHAQHMPTFSARELLDAHNSARREVGSPPLVWSTVLANHAKSWAEQLIAKHDFAHQPDNPHGENLLMISGGMLAPAEAVRAWIAEMPDYDPSSNTCTGVCVHYTQVVWRMTHAVGCGMAFDDNRQVWVCEYDPPGNVVGVRPY